jgi:hypothetical protein
LSESGALPTGVTFNPATGVLAGTPAAGTAGAYPLTFTAANGVDGGASQSFTLTVSQAPAITSAPAAVFAVGAPGAFTVTATGFPPPALSESGPLPTGVAFNPATGLLIGTPAAGTAGTYPLTFTAANSAGSVTQSFALTVFQPPSPPPPVRPPPPVSPPPPPSPPPPTKVFVNPAFTGAAGTHPASNPTATIGVDAFPTIGQGLAAVAAGGTVVVAAGSYAENLTLAKSVIVQGAGSGSTTVAGKSGTGLNVTTALGVGISGLTVSGFTNGIVAGAATDFLSLTDVRLTGNASSGAALIGVHTVLLAAAGNDTFFVTPLAVAQPGTNPVFYSNLHFLTVDGGGGSNTLQVFLNDTNAPDTVWVSSSAVSRDTAFFQVFYRATGGTFAGGITVVLGNGPETVVVQSQLAGSPTAVFAQGGDDVFDVVVTANSAYQNLTLDGGGGVNTVSVFDKSGGGTAVLVPLSDGTTEVDMSYGDGVLSRILNQNIQQVFSNAFPS